MLLGGRWGNGCFGAACGRQQDVLLGFVCHLPTQSHPSLAKDGSNFDTFRSAVPEGRRNRASTARRTLYCREDVLLAALSGIGGVLIHRIGSGQAT